MKPTPPFVYTHRRITPQRHEITFPSTRDTTTSAKEYDLLSKAKDNNAIHEKESQFHDEWAADTRVEDVKVRETFESPTALENRWILREMGDLRGKSILDVGAGLGESSVYFALQGADVTCTDLSPGMVDFAERLAKRHGVEVRGKVTTAEQLDVDAGAYDFVYVANLMHHVTRRRDTFGAIHRALRPGGRFFTWDPLAYNPVINVYRKMATDVRTDDESPLTFADVELARTFFVDVQHREFWVAALMLFLKYYAVDRVHPNADRYWKRIYRESARSLWWWRPLVGLDRALTRLPLVRRLAWNMVLCGRKGD
ncbi:MAG: SAM-dependent methyltransferase [Gemmatimonadetes bacterium]|nr:SAM-dependent methyltransferase [Gemmatimonadota bacterium]